MSRIGPMLESFARRGRKALIPYVTAGDPAGGPTVPLMHAMVESGADILELGVPFSDPMADGPVIQRAGERALAAGVSLATVLGQVREFRARDTKTPLVLMGYANPIEQFKGGRGAFVSVAREAGVDGLIVVDYPPEECADFARDVRAAGMDLIFLLAPTSTEARIEQVAKLASGYIYYVSLAGVTGAAHLELESVLKRVTEIRKKTALPVGVGFGISDGATARAIGAAADAVIIGSRLIREIEEGTPSQACARVGAFLGGIRDALDRAVNR